MEKIALVEIWDRFQEVFDADTNINNIRITSDVEKDTIKFCYRDYSKESLNEISNQNKLNGKVPDIIDCDCIDMYVVSDVFEDSETSETIQVIKTLGEYVLLKSKLNKNFIFEPIWSVHI